MHKIKKELIVFVVVGVIIIIELFLIIFGINQLLNLNKKITELKTTIFSTEKEWLLKDSYINKINKLKEDLQIFRNKSINIGEESGLFSFISSESKNFNIEINLLKSLPKINFASVGMNKFNYIPIKMEAGGNFHNFVRFLDFLQNSKYFFEITELNIYYSEGIGLMNMIICGLLKE